MLFTIIILSIQEVLQFLFFFSLSQTRHYSLKSRCFKGIAWRLKETFTTLERKRRMKMRRLTAPGETDSILSAHWRSLVACNWIWAYGLSFTYLHRFFFFAGLLGLPGSDRELCCCWLIAGLDTLHQGLMVASIFWRKESMLTSQIGVDWKKGSSLYVLSWQYVQGDNFWLKRLRLILDKQKS